MSGIIHTQYLNYSRFYMRWWLVQQDIPNNRSLIGWEIGLQGTGGRTAYWYSNAVRIDSGYLDGAHVNGSNTYSNITLAGDGLYALRSGSHWVGHNSDGSKNFGMSVAGWLYGNGSRSASGSWWLPTIPRNSQVTTDFSTYTLGSPIKIHANRKSTAFTHTITIRLHNSSGAVLQTIHNVADNTTWTPTSAQITAMQNAIPNTNNLTLYIHQHNNQVNAGSATAPTLILSEANPTFSNFTYKDSNTSTVAITGSDQILIKGRSTLTVTVPSADKMVAAKGATPNRYDFAYDGASNQVNYATTNVSTAFSDIATIGNRTIQVTAYDSRSNTTRVAKNVTVYDYAAPTISTTLTRENNFGDNTTVHIEGTYTPLAIGGSNKNTLTTGSLQYRYKNSDNVTWSTWTTRTFTANATDGTFSITDFVLSLSNQSKFDFEFKIADKFGTVNASNSVDIGTPIMFVGQNNGSAAIGINKMPEPGRALDVDGPIYSNGGKVVAGGILAGNGSSTADMSTGSSNFVNATGHEFTLDLALPSHVTVTFNVRHYVSSGRDVKLNISRNGVDLLPTASSEAMTFDHPNTGAARFSTISFTDSDLVPGEYIYRLRFTSGGTGTAIIQSSVWGYTVLPA